MTRYDKLAAMRPEQKNHWVEYNELPKMQERIFAEIGVADELSKLENGALANELTDKAVDLLYERFVKNSSITNEDCADAEKILLPLSDAAKKYTMYCIAHAHIDMDWLWGYHETVAIVLGTFRTMLDMMNEYPDFKFSQSQAATYDIAEKYDPELFEEMKARIKEGRWEFAGSAWVESDRNLPSAESISEHILTTKRYLAEKFGLDPKNINTDFHPDSFGHTPIMSELLNAGGVKYFYHCRGLDGRFIYRWKAPSGAEVLTVNEPSWYNDEIRSGYLSLVIPFCEMYGGIDGMIKVYGVGDHGGGPTRKDIEKLVDMQSWPVAPTVKFSTYTEYFAMLEKYRDRFGVYEEELGPTFTGCYTSESKLKTANRISEDRLTAAETLTAMAQIYADGKAYPKYREAWQKLLFNQFHDILPGSGIPETKDHALGSFEEVLADAGSGASLAMRRFAQNIDTSAYDTPDCRYTSKSEGAGVGCKIAEKQRYNLPNVERGRGKTRIVHLFNTTCYDRREISEIRIYDWPGNHEQLIVEDHTGKEVTFTVVGVNDGDNGHKCTTILIEAEVPSFGYSTYIIKEAEKTSYHFGAFTPDLRRLYYKKPILENENIRAEFDENDMTLISLIDKKTGKEYIDRPSAYFSYVIENDKYIGSSAWVEGIHTEEINLNSERRAVQTGHYANAVRSGLSYYIEFNDSKIEVKVTLDKDATALEFDVEADWREIYRHKGCPKLLFKAPFNYTTENYVYDIHLGTFTREQTSLHDWYGRDFIYAPNSGCKVLSLFTDTKYGYRGYDNTLQVSILRASSNPDPYPEFGKRTVRMALGIFDENYDELHRYALSLENDMPHISNTSHGGTLPLCANILSCDGACTTIVKTSEDRKSVTVRLYNPKENDSTAVLTFAKEIKSAALCDVAEFEKAPVEFDGNKISIELKKREMKTVTVNFN
ncbi:MAG: alpha-mannosidase [Clostridia bacterium]|nr:alpha-mannosidase [Clostridia bacterium]